MLFRVTGIVLLGTLALAGQTSTPALKDTEQPRPAPAELPSTYTFPAPKTNPNLDPRIAPSPLPQSKVALVGGTVREIDPIRNRMQVDLFGGGKMKVVFDGRTKVLSNGNEFSPMMIHKGDRVYLDTQSVQGQLFARQIQVNNMIEPTEIRGRIVGGDPEAGEVIILNTDSSSEVPVTVTQNTAIYFRNGPGQISQLQRGAFVAARFDSAAGNKNIGKDIRIILVPGETFRFAGRVHNLDMRSGALTINNDSDDKFYELRASKNDLRNSNIRIGTEVDVSAQFDGRDYVVRTMRVTRAADTPAAKDDKK